MFAKIFLIVCVQVLLIQLALSRCTGRPNLGAGLASYGLSSQILPSLGGSACGGNGLAGSAIPAILPAPVCTGLGNNGLAGPVITAPILPVSGCNGLGNNGLAGPVITTPILPASGCSGLGNNGLGYGIGGLGYGSGSGLAAEVIPTSGGSLIVTSSSALAPTGLSISSENVFEGSLYVIGELPFTGAAALDGVISSGGAGAVSYSLGNGVTSIESLASEAVAIEEAAAGYGLGLGGYGPAVGAIAPLSIAASGCNGGIGLGFGGYGFAAGGAPLSLGSGCNGAAFAPAAEIVAPNGGCGCGYQPGIYY